MAITDPRIRLQAFNIKYKNNSHKPNVIHKNTRLKATHTAKTSRILSPLSQVSDTLERTIRSGTPYSLKPLPQYNLPVTYTPSEGEAVFRFLSLATNKEARPKDIAEVVPARSLSDMEIDDPGTVTVSMFVAASDAVDAEMDEEKRRLSDGTNSDTHERPSTTFHDTPSYGSPPDTPIRIRVPWTPRFLTQKTCIPADQASLPISPVSNTGEMSEDPAPPPSHRLNEQTEESVSRPCETGIGLYTDIYEYVDNKDGEAAGDRERAQGAGPQPHPTNVPVTGMEGAQNATPLSTNQDAVPQPSTKKIRRAQTRAQRSDSLKPQEKAMRATRMQLTKLQRELDAKERTLADREHDAAHREAILQAREADPHSPQSLQRHQIDQLQAQVRALQQELAEEKQIYRETVEECKEVELMGKQDIMVDSTLEWHKDEMKRMYEEAEGYKKKISELEKRLSADDSPSQSSSLHATPRSRERADEMRPPNCPPIQAPLGLPALPDSTGNATGLYFPGRGAVNQGPMDGVVHHGLTAGPMPPFPTEGPLPQLPGENSVRQGPMEPPFGSVGRYADRDSVDARQLMRLNKHRDVNTQPAAGTESRRRRGSSGAKEKSGWKDVVMNRDDEE
jgi:hypothetical protein